MSDRNYWTTLRQRKISRRTMLGASAKAGVGAAGLALVGCGDDDDDEAVADAQADRRGRGRRERRGRPREAGRRVRGVRPLRPGRRLRPRGRKLTPPPWPPRRPSRRTPNAAAAAVAAAAAAPRQPTPHSDGRSSCRPGGAGQGGRWTAEAVDEGLGLLMTIPAGPRRSTVATQSPRRTSSSTGTGPWAAPSTTRTSWASPSCPPIVDASVVHLATPSPEVGLPRPQAGGMPFYSKAVIEEPRATSRHAGDRPVYGTGPFRRSTTAQSSPPGSW